MIFEYGLDSPQFGSLLLSFVAAFLSAFLVAHQPSARRTGARMLAVSLLAVLCVIVHGPLMLTGTLLVFATGDAFLAQNDDRATRFGQSFFLAGYVGYAVLFARGVEVSLYWSQPWRAAIAIVLPIAVVLILRGGHQMAGEFRLRAFASIIVSLALAGLAFGTVLPGLMVGAVVLVLYTALFARQFAPTSENWIPLFSWVLFYAAHLLITLAALALI